MVEIGILLLYIIFSVYQMISLNWTVGWAALAGAVVAFLLFLYTARKHFGGVTEDTAGFFVQICEVMMPLAALIAYKAWW
jgi:adenosylcobinamide-GDP ribazoletransferase